MENHQAAIETILNTKNREWITDFINQYGDTIDWINYTDHEILEEVSRSDIAAGETNDGILAGMYGSL